MIFFLSGSSSGENSYQERKKNFYNWSAQTGASVIDGGGGRLLLLVWFFAERSRINTSNESLKKAGNFNTCSIDAFVGCLLRLQWGVFEEHKHRTKFKQRKQ